MFVGLKCMMLTIFQNLKMAIHQKMLCNKPQAITTTIILFIIILPNYNYAHPNYSLNLPKREDNDNNGGSSSLLATLPYNFLFATASSAYQVNSFFSILKKGSILSKFTYRFIFPSPLTG